jgi:CRISPR system Cascade subunit CasC
MSIFIDFYALQSVPPSNINRDDTGSPKTAQYGGTLRARVSSQAWKRAMRSVFHKELKGENLGIRTKMVARLIADRIRADRQDLADQADDLAHDVLTATGLKLQKSKRSGSDEGAEETPYLVFIADSEIANLAHLAEQWSDDPQINPAKPSAKEKKEATALFHGKQALDIALFGRMLADTPDLNTDASSQVAHAISVNTITPEFDYFTAVDDKSSADNAGAAMIDTVAYNSSTLYRYATVDATSLAQQLGGGSVDIQAASRAVADFADAFFRSMPTGKENTFANRTLPSLCLAIVRNSQPINVVGAFEDAVKGTDGKAITTVAEEKLAGLIKQINENYGEKPLTSVYCTVGQPVEALDSIGSKVTFPQLKEDLAQAVVDHLNAGSQKDE